MSWCALVPYTLLSSSQVGVWGDALLGQVFLQQIKLLEVFWVLSVPTVRTSVNHGSSQSYAFTWGSNIAGGYFGILLGRRNSLQLPGF